MRITVLVPGGIGAFGNVARTIAKGLPESRFDVLYLNGPAAHHIPWVPGNVTMTRLDRRSRTCWVPLARHLRVARPDALISLSWYLHPAALLAVRIARTGTPLVLNEASSLSYKSWVEHRHEPGLRMLATLAPFLYPRADIVACVSTPVLDDLVHAVGVDPRKVPLQVVPNAVDAEEVIARSLLPDPRLVRPDTAPVFVAVARHVRQKNLPLLLRAFRRYLDDGGAGSLALVGSGPDTPFLRGLVAELDLTGLVKFRGGLLNPYPQIAAATALVQSSEEEGFGLAVVEAMALGVPVISTDCPGGPQEILCNGRHGMLVEQTEESLASAMQQLSSDAALRRSFRESGAERAQDYSPERIGRIWCDVLGGIRP